LEGLGRSKQPARHLRRIVGAHGRVRGLARGRAAAERASQEADTDQDADAIRLGAPDIVPVVSGDVVNA